jgi:hypothetical protein
MALSVPTKIRIKAKVAYEVVYVDKFDDPNQRGECRWDGDIRQIALRSDLSKRILWETLFHEIAHAIEWEYKLPIPHKIIHALEKPLLRILILNGWLSID